MGGTQSMNVQPSFTEEDQLEIAALGRPFKLGSLYDCRSDALIQGVTLWDADQLKKNTSVQPQNKTEFNVTASDSIEEKSHSLQIPGSLKLSLLGGLVNVDGSAKYFQDTKKSTKQARVTLHYKTTTKVETLTMSHLAHRKVTHPNVFSDGTATHVVTAILYGAGAYFMFDRVSSGEEDRKQVEGEANLAIAKLKNLTINSAASLNMNEEEKLAVEKFTCTFHGDFKLSSNPTSFNEAVSVYRKLPNMLGQDGEHAVPLRVWVYPLAKLDSRAARLQREISNDLIALSSEIIESLNQTEMRCRDLLKDSAATTFPGMEKKLQDFMQKCKHYKLGFMKKLGSVLPSIRGGGKEESALEDILKGHGNSPFNGKDLDEWLKIKGRESDTLKSFLEQLEKLETKSDKNLDDLLSDLNVKNVVCFTFTSVDQPDTFLDKLSHYFRPAEMMDTSEESTYQQDRNTDWLSADTRQTMRKQLRLFEELKKMSNSSDTKFTFGSKYDGSLPGACIYIYEDGSANAVCFVPPSKPASPTVTDVSHDSVTVTVSEPHSATVEYRLEYRIKQRHEWSFQALTKNEDEVTLSGLKPGSKYEIRATAMGKVGYAISSSVCSAVTPTAAGPPTHVKYTEVNANFITLTWTPPSVLPNVSVQGYIIEFREENSSEWQSEETGKQVNTFTLNDLKQNTVYFMRMRTNVGAGVSLPGEEFKIKTAKETLKKTKKCTQLPGDLPIYLLDLKQETIGQLKIKVYGSAPTKNQSNKTIMVVGATGSGKTTLINGMINYIIGVDWEDNYRFKLINEETHKTQANSQTSEVTAYQIYHTGSFQVPYSLTIIDTPGFGDTKGIKQDEKITEKLRQLFSIKGGIDSIDAVCFVVQSASARLTHTQKYIFDSILSIFGVDIASNILVLVTFADGKPPPALEAIEAAEISCARNPDGSVLHFKFNNSVLFAKNVGASDDEENFDRILWKMGKVSMKKFFDHLTTMQTQSLTLTKQVLQERKQLEATVEGVQPMIRKGLSKLEEINTTRAALQNHETHMKESEDFDYEVEVENSDRIEIEPGKFITNCHGCNYTCHYPCTIPKDEDKINCPAMVNGNCTVCPGKCAWSDHFNMTYRWDIKRIKEKRTYQDLKKKYETALGKKMTTEYTIRQLEVEYEQVQGKVAGMMGQLTKCLQRLREIALRPDPLATPDYVDLLIQTEVQEAKPGFQSRIKELQSMRERTVILKKWADNVDLTGKEKATWEKMKSTVKGLFNDPLGWFSN